MKYRLNRSVRNENHFENQQPIPFDAFECPNND